MKRILLIILTSLLITAPNAVAVIGPEFVYGGETFNTYTSPSGYQWRVVGENLQLFHPAGGEYAEDTVAKEWTPQEWEDTHSQLEVEAECAGRADNCVKDIEEGKTRLPRGTPPDEIEAGAEVITRERETAPYTEPEVTNSIDALGEWGGTLDAGAIASAASVVGGGLLLGPEAFKLGVDIGNGLDQILGFEEWNWGETEHEIDEQKHSEGWSRNVVWEKANGAFVPISGEYYARGCDGVVQCGGPEVAERVAETHVKVTECFSGPGGSPPGKEVPCSEDTETETALICAAEAEPDPCVPPPDAYEQAAPGHVGGIPVPNSKEQEEQNEQHEYEPSSGDYSGRKKVPALPVAPTATTNAPKLPGLGHKREPVLPKGRGAEQIQSPGPAEALTPSSKKAEETVKKHAEEEKKLIPEAYPGETAKQYQKRLEGLGFTNVTVVALGEVNENPNVGPEGVADISPSPGNEVTPDSKIQVSENPANAPEPGGSSSGEDSGALGPPSLPGFKFPNFGVLCQGFPFGVPCWLAETIDSWSAVGKAPEWGLEEFEVKGHKIAEGKIQLSHLEPIMEKVRPAMLIFATIGLVLLFYKFAKGGGPPSGGGGGDPGGGNSADDEACGMG